MVARQKAIPVLKMIIEDMAKDAKELDGQPFNGRTVATQLGRNMAAISALAGIVKQMVEES